MMNITLLTMVRGGRGFMERMLDDAGFAGAYLSHRAHEDEQRLGPALQTSDVIIVPLRDPMRHWTSVVHAGMREIDFQRGWQQLDWYGQHFNLLTVPIDIEHVRDTELHRVARRLGVRRLETDWKPVNAFAGKVGRPPALNFGPIYELPIVRKYYAMAPQ